MARPNATTTDAPSDQLTVGLFGDDGRKEAQIVDISPDRMVVTIEYTDTREQITLHRARLRVSGARFEVVA